MELFLTSMVQGIITGLIYSLIALGFVIIYKSSQVLNIAQGEFLLFGACIGWTFSCWSQNIWAGLLATGIACMALGAAAERSFIRPLIGQPLIAIIMVTIALSMLLRGILVAVWWSPPYVYPSQQLLRDLVITVGGIHLSIQSDYLLASAVCIISFLLFALFFKFTMLGLRMRAVADDHQAAQSVGINVRNVFKFVWVIAAVVGGIGGFLLGKILTVSPDLYALGLVAFPVAIVGGMDSVPGCILAGIMVGVAENLAGVYLDPFLPHSGGLRLIVPYLLMLFVLIVRPYGLFGLERIERI